MSQRWSPQRGSDPVLIVDATSGAETVPLTRMAADRRVTVRRTDSSSNTVTVAVTTGLYLDGVLNGTTTVGADSEKQFVSTDAGFESFGGGAGNAVTLAADPAFTNTYATFRGGSFIAIGDSITAGASSGVHNQHADTWATYLALATGLRLVRNAGVGGNTTAQMLARFDGDVLAYPSDFVIIMGGINDSLDGSNLPTSTAANIAAMVTKTRNAGRVPILWTITPGGTPASPASALALLKIATINTWIRRYAQDQKIDLIDGYQVVTDSATGAWSAADMTSDGTHPTPKGSRILGQYGAAQLAQRYALAPAPLCVQNADPTSLVTSNGCFLAMTGWTSYGGTGGTYTETTSSDAGNVVGNWLQVARSGVGDFRVHAERTIAAGGSTFAVGDEIEVAFRISTAGLEAAAADVPVFYCAVKAVGASTPNRITEVTLKADATGVWRARNVVPAGTTSLTIQIGSAKTSGTTAYGPLKIGQFAARNLTKLGALL